MPSHSYSCKFGLGKRSKVTSSSLFPSPSPNKYNLRMFPNTSSISHKMALSREEASFGSINLDIKNKALNPAPTGYKIKGTLRSTPFTIK